jgi:hypothetical protein
MIVRVTSYTRIRKAIKATVRYLKHRPNIEGERVTRPLFGSDGPMEKYHAYSMIEGASRGTIFYRIAISPDPNREDTNKDLDLWGMTQDAMRHLKVQMKKDIQYIAVEHDDQSDIRHVNAIVLVGGRLSKEEFRALPKLLKEGAWDAVKLQKPELDPETQYERPGKTARIETLDTGAFRQSRGGARPYYYLPTCSSCGPGQTLWRIDDGVYMCPDCGKQYDLTHSGGLQQEVAPLSL